MTCFQSVLFEKRRSVSVCASVHPSVSLCFLPLCFPLLCPSPLCFPPSVFSSIGNRTTLYLSHSWVSIEFGLVSLVSQKRARHHSGLEEIVVCLLSHATQWSLPCEPDLTVDLSNCVIDVISKCVLSLAACDTVVPAFEKLTVKFQLVCLLSRATPWSIRFLRTEQQRCGDARVVLSVVL